MSITNFCCCCDLRRGCVVFVWLQMMGIVMAITSAIAYSDYETNLILYQRIYNDSNNILFFNIFNVVLKLISAGFFIKGVTCISLTWGIIKTNYLFYQPWLFIHGVESCIETIITIIFFILGFAASFMFLGVFILCGIITGLNWYFWTCVYTVYRNDMKPSNITFELAYDYIRTPPSSTY